MPEFSASQMHGKVFENWIKSANGIFSYAASDRRRGANDMFDIGAEDDQKRKMPTSIKVAKANQNGEGTIALSDARVFWQSFDYRPYRLLVGLYRQEEGTKRFYEIHEFILQESKSAKKQMLGEVSLKEVQDFHSRLGQFAAGADNAKRAREWAREQKERLKDRMGAVQLNPKIDSKKQRRLQCSVALSQLLSIAKESGDHALYAERFGVHPLPLEIVSGRRAFRKAGQEA